MELKKARQIPHEKRRRWFYDTDADLIVWQNNSRKITGFQFCYTRGNAEKSLSWKQDKGFLHESVDNNLSDISNFTMTPLLKQNGLYDKNKILELFQQKSIRMDRRVRKFVESVLLAN